MSGRCRYKGARGACTGSVGGDGLYCDRHECGCGGAKPSSSDSCDSCAGGGKGSTASAGGSGSKVELATALFNSLDLNSNGYLSVFEATDFATANNINVRKFKSELGLESSQSVSRETFVSKYAAGTLPVLDPIVERMGVQAMSVSHLYTRTRCLPSPL